MTSTNARRKAKNARHARNVLLWGVSCFVAGQVIFGVVLAFHVAYGDREFGQKLGDLKAKQQANLAKPLVVMLGSSRVATGFRPDVAEQIESGKVATFNFAQVGTGPQLAHLVLHRMLKRGVKPDWVFVEFWPPFWGIDGYLNGYVDSLNLATLDWSDVRLLASYLPKSKQLFAKWLPAQLVPIFASRAVLLSRLGPAWAPQFDPDRRLQNLDANGWWAPRTSVTDDERTRLVEHYRGIYAKRLDHYAIRPTPDRALRNLIEVCRQESIKVAVVVLPEGTGFRALYPPETRAAVDAYLRRIASETTVIDARDWVGDDGFSDGHHLLPGGAAVFTTRLVRDAVAPLLHDEIPAVAIRPQPANVVH